MWCRSRWKILKWYLLNTYLTLSENDIEGWKTEPSPISLPSASRNFLKAKTRKFDKSHLSDIQSRWTWLRGHFYTRNVLKLSIKSQNYFGIFIRNFWYFPKIQLSKVWDHFLQCLCDCESVLQYLCCKHWQSLSSNVKWRRIYVFFGLWNLNSLSRLSKSNKSHSVFICHVVLIFMKLFSHQISRFFLSNHRGAEITEKKKSA